MMGLKLLPKQRPTPRDLPTPRALSLEPEDALSLEPDDGGRRTEDGGRKTEDGGQMTEDGGWSTKDRGGFQPNPQELMDLMGRLLAQLQNGKELESRVEKAEEELCRLLEAGDEMSRVLRRQAQVAVMEHNKLEALRRLTGHKLPPPMPSSPFSLASEQEGRDDE